MSQKKLENRRWWIAVAAVVMQLCLGSVYAWSVYKKPLIASHGWGETATQVTFMICIGMIGLAAAFGGQLVDRKGPRFVATIGAVLFGIGTILAGCADRVGSLPLLYLSFGFIAGLGNGFCYVTPVATLIRWFPDKRGLVTGLAIMGFGAGSFFMGQLAPVMVSNIGVAKTWMFWGVIFLVLVTLAAQYYRNPPAGWLPAGYAPSPARSVAAVDSLTFGAALSTPQWWMLWLVLFLNATAGLGLLSQLSPMAQEIQKATISDPKKLAVAGGVILSIAAIFNGLGRLFWAWVSDFIGRKTVFLMMFITQIGLYLLLAKVTEVVLFTIIACYLLSCYGGGFSTMPAFAADTFGPAHIGKIYGAMLTAWGAAGLVGPLVFAQLRDKALYVAAGLLVLGFLLTLSYRRLKEQSCFGN